VGAAPPRRLDPALTSKSRRGAAPTRIRALSYGGGPCCGSRAPRRSNLALISKSRRGAAPTRIRALSYGGGPCCGSRAPAAIEPRIDLRIAARRRSYKISGCHLDAGVLPVGAAPPRRLNLALISESRRGAAPTRIRALSYGGGPCCGSRAPRRSNIAPVSESRRGAAPTKYQAAISMLGFFPWEPRPRGDRTSH